MSKKKPESPRGPMIHIRLDVTTHQKLKIRVAHAGTTIQNLVASLICREVGGLNQSNNNKPA